MGDFFIEDEDGGGMMLSAIGKPDLDRLRVSAAKSAVTAAYWAGYDAGCRRCNEIMYEIIGPPEKRASASDDFAAWERVEAEIGTQARLMCSRVCSITLQGACHCTAATNDEWRGRAIKALRDRRR